MSEARLYILSESEFDDEFLRVIVERVTEFTVPATQERNACHHFGFIGINDDDPIEMEGFFLTLRARARTLGGDGPIWLVVVRDNDRGNFSPHADEPETAYAAPLGRTNRLRQLEQCRDLICTDDGNGPLFPCAVGVSVQMIETWILLALDPNTVESDLPIFAEKAHKSAKAHYHPDPVPPQLKNQYDTKSGYATRQKRRDFNRRIAEESDLDSLAERSSSFGAFVRELKSLAH
ncbi:MAG: hypothetical protein R3F19_30010 [Verrucomicrobiales bacterium]